MSNRSFFDKIMIRLAFVAMLLLLSTYASPYVVSKYFWFTSLLGLAYPFILLINILLAVYFLLRKSKFTWLILLVILAGWPLLSASVATNFLAIPQDTTATTSLKIMSYNVRNFDLYNWSENEEARESMMELIRVEDPDMVCFQEFYTEDIGEFHNVKFLVNNLNYKYYHFEQTLTLRGKDHWGLAIFSKHPIKKRDKVTFSNSKNNLAAYTDIDVMGQVVRLFNVHLQSIHLGKRDLKYVKSLKGLKKEDLSKIEEHIQSSTSILLKLKEAYRKRAIQAQDLAQHINRSPYPVIVCGDFNDTPTSYTYQMVKQDMKDAFLESGLGLGGTYNGPLPSFRIDYIFTDSTFLIHDFDVIHKDYSDHYPITCTFGMPTTKEQ